MTTNYFQELMQDGFHCRTIGPVAMGEWEGYPYSVEFSRGNPCVFSFRFVVQGTENAPSTARAVAKQLKEGDIPHTSWSSAHDTGHKENSVLLARLVPPSDFYAKGDVHSVLLAAVAALHTAGLRPPESCPLCGLAQCDAWAYLDDGCRKTHKACVDTRLDLPTQDVTPPVRVQGNHFTGLLGALFGAFIGALPNWAQALSASKIHWALYAFIPILSALGYRLFRGKATRVYSWVVVLAASLLSAMALEQVWYWLYLTTTTGQPFSFSVSIPQYFATHNLGITLQEMYMCLIALLVGMFPASVFLKYYTDKGQVQGRTVRGAAFVRESVALMHPPDAPEDGDTANDEPDNSPTGEENTT